MPSISVRTCSESCLGGELHGIEARDAGRCRRNSNPPACPAYRPIRALGVCSRSSPTSSVLCLHRLTARFQVHRLHNVAPERTSVKLELHVSSL